MKKFSFVLLVFAIPFAANAQQVFEIKFTTQNTPYKAAMLLWDGGYGKMRIKFTRNDVVIMVEESVEETMKDGRISLFGSNVVYPGGLIRFTGYQPDNFFIVKKGGEDVAITGVDNGFKYTGCTMREIDGSNEKQLFLSDFDWRLNYDIPPAFGLYPQGTTRILISDDVAHLSRKQLRIMRNEIFARHGYIFNTPDMKKYFEAQTWYTPTYAEVKNQLSRIEKMNVEMIQQYEK
jgi:hypothetical protein